MNTPNDSDSQIANLYDEIPAVEPITTQVRKLNLDAWPLAKAEAEHLARERAKYVTALIPADMGQEELRRRLSCGGLECYTDCNGTLCIVTIEAGEQHREQVRNERQARVDEVRRHRLAVEKEVTERRLTEIDPTWREHFNGDWNIAARFYHEELSRIDRRPSRTIHTSAFEPPTFAKPDRDESDDGFDSDLEPQS